MVDLLFQRSNSAQSLQRWEGWSLPSQWKLQLRAQIWTVNIELYQVYIEFVDCYSSLFNRSSFTGTCCKIHAVSKAKVLTSVPWNLDPRILLWLCWPTMSRWSYHRILTENMPYFKHHECIFYTSLIFMKYSWKISQNITWNQVGYTTCKCHPCVGNFWSAYFSAFHPYECEDSSEEASDDGADSQRSAGV